MFDLVCCVLYLLHFQDASVPVKDDVKIPDDQQKISLRSNSFTGRNLTEIDENEFFYEENHRFSINDESISCKDLENSSINNYQIDECSDDDDDDDAQNDEETRNQDENGTDNEQDHVKILGKAIENLQRKLPTSNDEQKRNDFLQRTFSIQDKVKAIPTCYFCLVSNRRDRRALFSF